MRLILDPEMLQTFSWQYTNQNWQQSFHKVIIAEKWWEWERLGKNWSWLVG